MSGHTSDHGNIEKRLDVIINLLFKLAEEQGKSFSIKDKIVTLHSFGLAPVEIAAITGKSQIHVNKELTLYRRAKGSFKRGRQEWISNNSTS